MGGSEPDGGVVAKMHSYKGLGDASDAKKV